MVAEQADRRMDVHTTCNVVERCGLMQQKTETDRQIDRHT